MVPTAEPIVKWPGGKRRLVDDLIARLPKRFHRYFEPFLGGGALFFRLSPTSAVLSDANADLIEMYQAVRDDVEAVIACLEEHAKQHSPQHYYATRSLFNRRTQPRSARAAAFLYLNRTCYNGLWRVNRRGEFNAPLGRYASPTICCPDRLRKASAVLRHADLRVASYEIVVNRARRGDLVYFDPPYAPRSTTAKFVEYTSEGFGISQQRELAAAFRDLDRRGCFVILSNSDTPFVRELYEGYRIDVVKCSRVINCQREGRAQVTEVIVTNVDPGAIP